MVVIGPHNPTGHAPSTDEWNEISKFCLTHNLPLICDEVFRNFWWGTENLVRPDPKDFPLLLTLDGLSKSFGLPGLKSGWVVLEGRDQSRVALLRRALEHLLDAFLAVSEQSQAATEALLKSSVGQAWMRSLAAQVGQRVANWGSAARAGGVEILVPLAGWHLIWPRNEPETENPADALRKETSRLRQLVLDHGIVVHSGTWYGLSHGDLVTTGLTRPTPALIRALAAG
jgi:aspartate/methionine/tyrosine aminotransferase